MKKKKILFWRSVLALIGAIIGVGIFGIPYVAAKAGFILAIGYILLLGSINLMMVLGYAEIVGHFDGRSRLVGSVRRHLGEHWGMLMACALFAGIWGAMVAYTIIGGEFLYTLLHGLLGGKIFIFQISFLVVMSLLLIGGLGMVSRIQGMFVVFLLILLLFIFIGSIPSIELSRLTGFSFDKVFLPFGVILFAFGGLAVVPEMKQILGSRYSALLPKASVVGFALISAVYILFTATVVAVTGLHTSEEAIIGLGKELGDWALYTGVLIGLISVATSFLILGVEVMDTLIYDYKRRYLIAYFMAVIPPATVFFLGARDFINVIGFTGGVLASIVGLIFIAMYVRLKKSAWLPKRALRIPNFVMYLAGFVLLSGMITTIAQAIL
ncbi:hypothetical protein D6827_03055 [Candidatus Parcubacteria bacterium]|nr:MAG: hypothetical protein D6827_03055 [Candidatus Parcubacteria bacterium]